MTRLVAASLAFALTLTVGLSAQTKKYGKPLVANSDAHNIWMFGRHYTLVDAEPTMPSIFRAVRERRVECHSPHITMWECLRMFVFDPLLYRKRGRVVETFAS